MNTNVVPVFKGENAGLSFYSAKMAELFQLFGIDITSPCRHFKSKKLEDGYAFELGDEWEGISVVQWSGRITLSEFAYDKRRVVETTISTDCSDKTVHQISAPLDQDNRLMVGEAEQVDVKNPSAVYDCIHRHVIRGLAILKVGRKFEFH